MATISDVAKKAGVSVATVSRLLNGTAYVNQDTSDKINKAIKELNYRTNRIAQTLYTKKSLNIAMVVNDISNPITATYVKGVESVSEEYNYNFILCCTNFELEKEKKYISSLVEKQIDGIIISPCGSSNEHIKEAVAADVPIVFITRRLHEIDADFIKFDDIDGGFQLTEHLVACGYKEIFAIGRDVYDVNHKNRLQGYFEVLSNAGLPVNDDYCYFGNASMQSGYEAMTCFVDKYSRVPQAVYATTSMIAAGVIQYCKDHSILIPQDMGLVSFESFMDFNGIIEPEITYYDIPIFKLGTVAAEVLFDKINKKVTESQQIILRGEVKTLKSTRHL